MNKFVLTKENDPRCPEFYKKAFVKMSETEREKLRLNWINKNINKK